MVFYGIACMRGATVYAFEPIKSTIDLLRETIAINDIEDNVNIVKKGLGARN